MKKYSPALVGLFQAAGLLLYCSLIGLLIYNGETLFGKLGEFVAPILFLVLFAVSALICAIITLGYPFLVLWESKNTKRAVSIVLFTAVYLALAVASLMVYLSTFA